MYLPFFQCRFKAWYKFYLFELTNQLSNYIGYTSLLIECTHPLWKSSIMSNCWENMVRGNFSWFFLYNDISNSLLCASFISLITIQKYGRKIQNKTMFIRVYFQRYAFHPKNQEKLWSEEIITKIALELIHVSIYLSMSF